MRGSGTVWLIANRPLIPTRPVFSVESTGPNMSGPLTVTITGLPSERS